MAVPLCRQVDRRVEVGSVIMIELKSICKTYTIGNQQVQAVNNVSLVINEGEFVAIMGASGSGKSTLMHMLGLLDRPDSGTYKLAGYDVTKLSDGQMALVRTIGL